MTGPEDNRCTQCGQPLLDHPTHQPAKPGGPESTAVPEEPQEYDHRGLPLPRRSRNGGIITPQ